VATRIVESFSFGGVDSRSNPLNFPTNRSLRCLNWIRTQGGWLKLRYGYTEPAMSAVVASTIHSAYQYEQNDGTRFILFGQGTQLKQMEVGAVGTASTIATLSSSSSFNGFFANNKFHLGNGVDEKVYDGGTLRNIGLRAVTRGEIIAMDPTVNTASGNWAVTNLTGYRLFAALYNPNTGQVGNRLAMDRLVDSGFQNTPSTASSTGVGNAWAAPANALVSDDARSSVSTTSGSDGSQVLRVQGFGFSIPAGSTILGIEFGVERSVDVNGPGTDKATWDVGAIKSDDALSQEFIRKGSDIWPPPGSEVHVTKGGPEQLFGEVWLPGDINNANFGCWIQFPAAMPLTSIWQIDHVRARVYYLEIERFVITQTQSQIVISGLPDLSSEDTELLKVFGRTVDGGGVPHIMTDVNGNFITAANTATVATLTTDTIDPGLELPIRNGLPPNFNIGTRVLGRSYVIDFDDPSKIRYSEGDADDVDGFFLGLPSHSWPASNEIPFPTGESGLGLHEVDNEVWVWSRNHLAIFTELGDFSAGGRAFPSLRGVWVGGIAGPRAFIKTPYGPFWLSHDRELMTRSQSGPVVVSEEYQYELLAKLDPAQLSTVELSYLRDPERDIDRIYIKGNDTSNNPVIVIHDFKLRSAQSPLGEGSEYSYAGMTASVFVRFPQSVISMRDENSRWQLWTGAEDGKFYQLEDGADDNGATYSADYVGVLNAGPDQPLIAHLDFSGDKEIEFRATPELDLTLTELGSLELLTVDEQDVDTHRYRVNIEEPVQHMVFRIQRTSELGQSLDDNSPKHIPLETYGRLYVVRPELGRPRRQGGRQK